MLKDLSYSFSAMTLMELTRCLNSCLSSMVIVSDLAMTGIMLTEWLKRFMNSMSNCRSLQEKNREDKGVSDFSRLRLVYNSTTRLIYVSEKT